MMASKTMMASKIADKINSEDMTEDQINAFIDGVAFANGWEAEALYRTAQNVYYERYERNVQSPLNLPVCRSTEDLMAANID